MLIQNTHIHIHILTHTLHTFTKRHMHHNIKIYKHHTLTYLGGVVCVHQSVRVHTQFVQPIKVFHQSIGVALVQSSLE